MLNSIGLETVNPHLILPNLGLFMFLLLMVYILLCGCAITKPNIRQMIQLVVTSNGGLLIGILHQIAHLNLFLNASVSIIKITLLVPNQSAQS